MVIYGEHPRRCSPLISIKELNPVPEPVVILRGLLQPDYSHVVMPVSALAVWPHGWIQNVNFYVFGLLMIATPWGRTLECVPHVTYRFSPP